VGVNRTVGTEPGLQVAARGLWAITFANAAVILPKGNVQDPMNAVFDAPVTANSLSKLNRVTGQT